MMRHENTSLPAEVKELQVMVVGLHGELDELKNTIQKMEKVAQHYEEVAKNRENENNYLRDRLCELRRQIYSSKSEKLKKLLSEDGFEAGLLFETLTGNDADKKEEASVAAEKITIPEHTREKKKKNGRKPLPEHLERIEVEHDIADEDKVCQCGCELSRIGEEVSEQLEMSPAEFWVIKNIRPKYACKNCEGVETDGGAVKIAPVPAQMIPKSFATPSLLSHILVGKFCDSLPFYRQAKQFSRNGFELSRSTMCNWSMKVAERCKPLLELLNRYVLSGPLINIDETPFQVLREPERNVDSKSYMWVFRGGPPGKPAIYFHYSETRNHTVAQDFLGDYRGFVQTDGYGGYNFLDSREGVEHFACWAHVRRKFYTVADILGNKAGMKSGKAHEALRFIGRLYAIEKEIRVMRYCPEKTRELRREQSKPIVDEFEVWLKEIAPDVPPKSSLGKALNYTLGQWPRLKNYVNNGIVGMDNNLAENAIRPFVVGRKNWLFFEQPDGATAGAMLYSLIETAKANGLEAYHYLLYIFNKLPHMHCDEQLKALLPWNLTTKILNDHKNQYMGRRVVS